MYSKIFAIAPCLALVSAIDFGQWAPPGPGDVRGPCPALNTMANHGILPHNGKGLTVSMMMNAMHETFNIGLDVRTILAIGGLFASPNPLAGSLDLNDLDKHNFIEHDGSLSRADFGEGGDDHTFNPEIFQTFMDYFQGMDKTTIEASAKARFMRIRTEHGRDPTFTYGTKQFLTSYGETALYALGLGGRDATVPVEFLTTFFQEERLPVEEGWSPPDAEIDLTAIIGLIKSLINASGDAVPEGLILGNASFARALLGLDTTLNETSTAIQNILNKFDLGWVLGE